MSKLDEIFSIINENERCEALIKYARTLNIKAKTVKNQDGGISENKLAVRIYEAEQARKNNALRNTVFIFMAAFFVGIIFILVFMLKRIMG